MSKEWRQRPSSLLGIDDDPYLAYCLDEAVYMFGRYVENEMQAAEDRTKSAANKAGARQQALTNILNARPEDTPPGESPVDPPAARSRFRDPAAGFKK